MTDRTILVADIGGTQARLALARGGAVLAGSLMRALVADHASPAALIGAFLAARKARPLRMVLALAGPVSGDRGRLTNGDWAFDAGELAQVTGGPVRLVNDLTALGHALPHLRPDQVSRIAGDPPRAPRQALVMGVGTGFNLAPVLFEEGRAHVLACEYGHVAPPAPVLRALGRDAACIEDAFSGRGFDALGDPVRFARALGVLARELRIAVQPDGGVWLAGSVARAALAGDGRTAFVTEATRPAEAPEAALSLITDDAAALAGCARL